MTNNKLFCPLFVASATCELNECLHEKCAFYENEKGVCAIVAIAANIEEIKKYLA